MPWLGGRWTRRYRASGSMRGVRGARRLDLYRIDLRCLFAYSPRIDDELERVRILIFFHQLQVRETLRALEGIAAGKFWLCGFDQLRGHLIPAVLGKAVRR